jgi:hypothetical protein
MGIELELLVLLALVIFGTSLFAVFEVETPRWRKVAKWLVVCGGTVGSYFACGHVAVVFPIGLAAVSVGYHVWWCHRHGIDALHATPRRKYYELRGWHWHD